MTRSHSVAGNYVQHWSILAPTWNRW